MAGEFDAIVLGSEIDGLVAATMLARSGRSVLVLERHEEFGGRFAAVEVLPGCRALLQRPEPLPLHPEVASALDLDENLADTLLEWRVVQPEGETFRLPAQGEHWRAELQRTSEKDARRAESFAERFARLGEVFGLLHGLVPPAWSGPERGELWDLLKVALRLRGLGSRELHEFLRTLPLSVRDLGEEWFESSWMRVAMAQRATEFAQLGPRSSGGGMRFLDALASGFLAGAVGPVRRRVAASRLLAEVKQAAERAGVTLRNNSSVQGIEVDDGKVSGVVLHDGEVLHASVVVSALDVKTTCLDLLAPMVMATDLLADVRHQRMRGGISRVHLVTDRRPAFLDAPGGEFVTAILAQEVDDLERGLDALEFGELPARPVLEVSVDPTTAGTGEECVLSVSVHGTASDSRQGPVALEGQDVLARTLETLALYDRKLPDSVQKSSVLTPKDLEQHHHLRGGHLQHGDVMLDQFFVLRPTAGLSRYQTTVPGLYLCGPGTHPGDSAPGLSGVLAARAVESS